MGRIYFVQVSALRQVAFALLLGFVADVMAICAIDAKALGWKATFATVGLLLVVLAALALVNAVRIVCTKLRVIFGWQ